jgi:UDP-galactopyranose mutase
VWDYSQQFTVFNRFTNSPVANYEDELYSMHFNMYMLNKI